MAKFIRSIRRSKDREVKSLVSDLSKDLMKPDDECDNCKIDAGDECFLTCTKLYERNKVRCKSKLDKLKALTGDVKLG